jgi:dephospho-CoA kinase
MSLKVGITGGIGSGKSAICDIFRILGVPVFNSDLEGRLLLEEDKEVKEAVIRLFGEKAYSSDGKPDRKYIASRAFADADKLAKLNGVIHPAVEKRFNDWCTTHSKAAYVIKEAAILVESGSYKHLDVLVVVSAPEELRIKRTSERDKITREEVLKRSRNQLPPEELQKFAQYTVVNDGETALIPQVMNLHAILKEKAAHP